MSNQQASNAFDESKDEVLAILKDMLNAVQNQTKPEDLHWGHVGDMNRIKEQLVTIVNESTPTSIKSGLTQHGLYRKGE